MATLPFRIAIADDHPAVLIGIAHQLAADSTIKVIGTARDSSELIALLDANECDVVITDYAMPGGAYGDGATLLSHIKRRYPQINIVVFTMIENPGLIQNMIAQGIRGIVSKADSTRHLVLATEAAMADRNYLSPAIHAALAAVSANGTRPLSQRESEVVRMFVSGMTVNEIAARLNRSKQTVSAQKIAAMKKLGIERETDLYQYAISGGLTQVKDDNGS